MNPTAEGPLPPLSEEQSVVLLCARTHLEEPACERLRRLMDDPLDWEHLLAIAEHHHTSALLHHHLTSVVPGQVPSPVLDYLRSRYFLLAARNLRLIAGAIPVLRDLDSAGAPAVIWKGPALAHSVYPSPELRTFTDLDLIVRRADVPAAHGVLKQHGFVALIRSAEPEAAVFERSDGAVTLTNRQTEAVIDLHWGSAERYLSPVMDSEWLWTQSRLLDLDGGPVRALRLEPMLLALCAHGAKHGPVPWPILKWVTDLEALVRRLPPDRWDPLLSQARAMGCHRMVLLGMQMADRLLDLPLPEEVREDLRADPVARSLAASAAERMFSTSTEPVAFIFSERWRFDFAVRERLRDRIRYAMARILIPSRRDIEATPHATRASRIPRRMIRLAREYLMNPSRARTFLLGPSDPSDRSDG